MGILYSILDLIIIGIICMSVAGLVISLENWKVKMGLLPRFKDRGGKKRIENPQFK